MANPTGNPFDTSVKLPKNPDDLKKLQVRVVLAKMAPAPRCYAQRLKDSEEYMDSSANQPSSKRREALCDRFRRIQNAQRAMTPLTIQLLNEKRGIFEPAFKLEGQQPSNNPEDNQHMSGGQRLQMQRRLNYKKQ